MDLWSSLILAFIVLKNLFFLALNNFWWVLVPFYLYKKLEKVYIYWLQWEFWFPNFKWVTLELIPPKDLNKSFKSMEDVFSGLWGAMLMPSNWREYWLEGMPKEYEGPLWMTLDICSFGGDIHFYSKVPVGARSNLEAVFYSQYPDCEIYQVPDYTLKIPKDIPNKDYNVKGEDQMLLFEDAYPIRTYRDFFEPEIGALTDERLVDPMHSLMEAMAVLEEGDTVLMQMGLVPVIGPGVGFFKEAQKVVDKMLGKEEKKKAAMDFIGDSILWKELTDDYVFRREFGRLFDAEIKPDAPKKEEKEKDKSKDLTQFERDKLKAIQSKISKRIFGTWIRTVYIGDKSKKRNSGNFGVTRNYFQHFIGHNGLRFSPHTRTKINYFMRGRRLFLRAREMIRKYVNILPPTGFVYEQKKPYFMLNVEELATIFHFPTQYDTVKITHSDVKKGEPPINLPIEKEDEQ